MEKEKQISETLVIPVSNGMALRVHIGEAGIVYCLKDVCEILGKSYKKARRAVDPTNLSWYRTPTEGGMQWMTFLSWEHVFDFIDKLPFGKVKWFLDLLTETVLPSVEAFLADAAKSGEESFNEATFHKFDKATDQSTDRATDKTTDKSTHESTDRSTEVTQMDDPHQIVMVINLK